MRSNTLKISIVLAALVLFALIGFFIILSIVKSKALQVSSLNNQVTLNAMYASENHSLSSLVDDITPDMQTLSSRIVTTTSAVAFIGSLESLAKQEGLTILVNSINNTDYTPDPSYQWLQISFGTQGSWQSTYQFLSLLQTMPYKISLGNIALNFTSAVVTTGTGKDQKNVNEGVWNASFTLNVLQTK